MIWTKYQMKIGYPDISENCINAGFGTFRQWHHSGQAFLAAPISTGEFNKSGKLAKSITFFIPTSSITWNLSGCGDSVVAVVSIFKYFQLQTKSCAGWVDLVSLRWQFKMEFLISFQWSILNATSIKESYETAYPAKRTEFLEKWNISVAKAGVATISLLYSLLMAVNSGALQNKRN